VISPFFQETKEYEKESIKDAPCLSPQIVETKVEEEPAVPFSDPHMFAFVGELNGVSESVIVLGDPFFTISDHRKFDYSKIDDFSVQKIDAADELNLYSFEIGIDVFKFVLKNEKEGPEFMSRFIERLNSAQEETTDTEESCPSSSSTSSDSSIEDQ